MSKCVSIWKCAWKGVWKGVLDINLCVYTTHRDEGHEAEGAVDVAAVEDMVTVQALRLPLGA